jgi:N-acylneuraminate cytidylyltransferase
MTFSNVIAIIPARSGSKGIPNKNVKLLGDYPLLGYSIAAAKLCGIEKVWFSTDSEEYAVIAKKFGAEVPFLRSPEISSDQSTDYEFMDHAMRWHADNFGDLPEYWIHLRPTTPLRDPKLIRNAIDEMLKTEEVDSLRSAHEVPESPFKWFLKDDDNLFKGLRDDLTPEMVNEPRQSFPIAYNPNGYIDIVKASHVLNSANLHGERMYVYETPSCTEIDTLEDFEYLNYRLGKYNSPLTDYLQNF